MTRGTILSTLLRNKAAESRSAGNGGGLEFKTVPYINQQEMYRYVYDRLRHGGSLGIFPEGTPPFFLSHRVHFIHVSRRQP